MSVLSIKLNILYVLASCAEYCHAFCMVQSRFGKARNCRASGRPARWHGKFLTRHMQQSGLASPQTRLMPWCALLALNALASVTSPSMACYGAKRLPDHLNDVSETGLHFHWGCPVLCMLFAACMLYAVMGCNEAGMKLQRSMIRCTRPR